MLLAPAYSAFILSPSPSYLPVCARAPAPMGMMGTEASARELWLAKLQVPVYNSPTGAPEPIAPTASPAAPDDPSSWLTAKAAWLVSLDSPTWGTAAEVVNEMASEAAAFAQMGADCNAGVHAACEELSVEESAKAAWLARLDQESWSAASSVVSHIASAPTEESAKQAWLARLDVPVATWGKAAKVMSEIVVNAAEMATREGDAKAAWLAKLDVATWGKAAAAVSEMSAKAAWLERLEVPTRAGMMPPELADAIGAVAPTKPAFRADTHLIVPGQEEAAKARWLAQLDKGKWAAASRVVNEMAADATQLARLQNKCDAGVDAACFELSSEEAAKRSWLAKLDLPAWAAASAVVSHLANAPAAADAKAAWLARLDAPTWSKGALAVSEMAADAAAMAELSAECDAGMAKACTQLSYEDAAKAAWLARIDAPTWADAASAVAQASSIAADEEASAKDAWLARLDTPSHAAAGAQGVVVPTAPGLEQFGVDITNIDSLSNLAAASEKTISELESLVDMIKGVKSLISS